MIAPATPRPGAAWASAGVTCDELSTPALVLNLPATGETPLGRLLRSARADAEPLHVSLRLLLRHPLRDDPALAQREGFVCENPTIVALAAAGIGRACAPLVCVNGQFATPSVVLPTTSRGRSPVTLSRRFRPDGVDDRASRHG